ncbi:DUF1292 domain-containing protein [Paenibacillus sp. FSL W8-0194]|uniref:DUF1292 domain-containing protein n=1 Tax=Paenibacillus sp. FSL W8-0194 TaxID=2921711 RepID=UPI0030DB4FB9
MANERNLFEEEPDIIYIPDDEGNEEEFEVIMKFEVDGSDNKYMMVVPLEAGEDEDSDEVYAFRYEEDGDDLKLYMIEDDAEWEIVEETFNTLVAELDGGNEHE